MPKIMLTKLGSAERQLTEAIHLFFEERDPLAIHTLAGAAGRVTADLMKARGLPSLLRNGAMIVPERRAEVMAEMFAPENFLKHADRDPEATLEFNPEVTAFFIFAAVIELESLTQQQFLAGSLFKTWFFVNYPDTLADVPENAASKATAERHRASGLTLEKAKFLQLLKHPPSMEGPAPSAP